MATSSGATERESGGWGCERARARALSQLGVRESGALSERERVEAGGRVHDSQES
jgi:hypothetical protein